MALHADGIEQASTPKNQPIQPGKGAGQLAELIGVVYVLFLAGPWLKDWLAQWMNGQEKGRLQLLLSLLVVALPLLLRLLGRRKPAAAPEDATRPLTPV